jgi:hypothetical protein
MNTSLSTVQLAEDIIYAEAKLAKASTVLAKRAALKSVLNLRAEFFKREDAEEVAAEYLIQ